MRKKIIIKKKRKNAYVGKKVLFTRKEEKKVGSNDIDHFWIKDVINSRKKTTTASYMKKKRGINGNTGSPYRRRQK